MPYERFKEEIVEIEREWEGTNIQDLPYATLQTYAELRKMYRAYQGAARRRKARLG